jgi:signal transduction histidine kinase
LKPKLTLILLLIVAVPLAVVGWLGARIVRDEQTVVEHRIRELATGQLRAIDSVITAALSAYENRVLEEMRPFDANREELRRRSRESSLVSQYYVVDADGSLSYPPVSTPTELTQSEKDALQRTAQLWDGGSLLSGAGEEGADSTSGWRPWYWGNGLQWMYWVREGSQIYVAEINRSRFLAELMAALPDGEVDVAAMAGGQVRLLDSTGDVLYQWGTGGDEDASLRVAAQLPLRAPLSTWSLSMTTTDNPAFARTVTSGFLLTMVPSLGLLILLVVGLAYYLHREQTRALREASQRVSFVNQVSHELKTPLTNIRMYAEMLEAEIDEQNTRAVRYLGVIVSESQRLSRLIANVLSFSRHQRDTLSLRYQVAVPDEVLRGVMEHFAPSLQTRGITTELDLQAGEARSFDPDVLGQIVGNLVSNVEKYAAQGKHLRVESQLKGEVLEVFIEDRGPGIPDRERSRVFEPFYRVNNELSEGVSGTGIGLSISRELARLHGGDVVLEPSPARVTGARFRVMLRCPHVMDKASPQREESA